MNPFRLSSRVRPPPWGARTGAARISSAVRERAAIAPPPSNNVGVGVGVGADVSADAGAEADADAGALEVPWRVTARSESGVLEVTHRGEYPVHSVRFALAGNGVLGLTLPSTVLPGERVRVVVRGGTAEGCSGAADAMLILRWFEPDGREFLWPIALD